MAQLLKKTLILSNHGPCHANDRYFWLKALRRDDWNYKQITDAQLCSAHFILGKLTFNQSAVICGELKSSHITE